MPQTYLKLMLVICLGDMYRYMYKHVYIFIHTYMNTYIIHLYICICNTGESLKGLAPRAVRLRGAGQGQPHGAGRHCRFPQLDARPSTKMKSQHTPKYPVRHTEYHSIKTIRPSLEVHWRVLENSGLFV